MNQLNFSIGTKLFFVDGEMMSKAFLSFYSLWLEVIGTWPPLLEIGELRPGEMTLVISRHPEEPEQEIYQSSLKSLTYWSVEAWLWLSTNHLTFLSLIWLICEMGRGVLCAWRLWACRWPLEKSSLCESYDAVNNTTNTQDTSYQVLWWKTRLRLFLEL